MFKKYDKIYKKLSLFILKIKISKVERLTLAQLSLKSYYHYLMI
jgi:hypothetical protein